MAAAVPWHRRRRRQLAFHVQAGSYDTASLIGVLKQLRRFLRRAAGHAGVLERTGRPPQPRAMRAFLATQRDWLVVERLPACTTTRPVGALWSNLKGQELANLACDTLGTKIIQATRQGIDRVRRAA